MVSKFLNRRWMPLVVQLGKWQSIGAMSRFTSKCASMTWVASIMLALLKHKWEAFYFCSQWLCMGCWMEQGLTMYRNTMFHEWCSRFISWIPFNCSSSVVTVFAIWFSPLFEPVFQIWIAFVHHTQRHTLDIRLECQYTWKCFQLTIKTICCGSFRVAEERPGWCPDPHKPPCAG